MSHRLLGLAFTLSLMGGASSANPGRFYEDALKRYEKQDYEGAVVQLKNVLQADPKQLAAQLLLGRALLASSQVAAAEVALREALRLGVSRSELVVELAESLLAQGKQADLISDPLFASRGLPASVQFSLLLTQAAAASELGDAAAASRYVDEARRISPQDPGSWLAEVSLRLRSGQLPEAATAAERALALAPDNAEAQYQRGAVHHAQGQVPAALQRYAQALKLEPKHLEALISQAGLKLDLNQPIQLELNSLQQIAPKDPRTSYLRASNAMRSGDLAAAQQAMRSITELLDPVPIAYIRNRPQMLILNAVAHLTLGQTVKATPYLEAALRVQPRSPLVKPLAQIALNEGQPGRAMELLQPYVRDNPNDSQAILLMASAQMGMGLHARATALIQQALQVNDSPNYRSALGFSLLQGGNSAQARLELENAFNKDSRQIHAGLGLVTLYLRQGETAQAKRVAERIAAAHPDNPTVAVMLGNVRLSSRDLEGARKAFQEALKRAPKLVDAHIGLARADTQAQQYASANQRLRSLLREEGDKARIEFELALLHEVWGKEAEARRWLESAAESAAPADTKPGLAVIAWTLRKAEPKTALAMARKLLARSPNDPVVLQAAADAYAANDDLSNARSALAAAARNAGANVDTLNAIAQRQVQLQDAAGARASSEAVLTAQPDNLQAQAALASLDLAQGATATSERRARRLIETHPKSAMGHNLLADVHLAKNQLNLAIESLKEAHRLANDGASLGRLARAMASQPAEMGKAITLVRQWNQRNPRNLDSRKLLVELLVRGNQLEAAGKELRAALQMSPNDVELLNNLANVQMELKDPAALQTAERALTLSPNSPIVIDTAGWANHLAGRPERALQLLRDARLRAPGSPDIRYHLGMALAAAGRVQEARQELNEALRMAPDFRHASAARRQLDTLK